MKKIFLLLLLSIFLISLVNANTVTTTTNYSSPSGLTGPHTGSYGIRIYVNETFKLTAVGDAYPESSTATLKNDSGTVINSVLSTTGRFIFNDVLYAGSYYRIETTTNGNYPFSTQVYPKQFNTFTLANSSANGANWATPYILKLTNISYEIELGSGNDTLYKCFQNDTNKFLSIDFKNETTLKQNTINTLDITFNYNVNNHPVNVTYIYTSPYESYKYFFCSNPVNNITLNMSASYSSSTINNNPQRVYYENLSLNGTTSNRTLWTLPSSLGSYSTFQIVDGAFTPIQGAFVYINRTGYGIVGAGFTDGSGLITFWLDPVASYNLFASAPTYSQFSTTLIPTQQSYTINLGTGTLSSGTTINNYNRGIEYTILPRTNYLYNNTAYQFNMTLSSSYYALDEFGLSLLNNSNQVIANFSSTDSSGGFVGFTASTGNNKLVKLNAYWKVNGTYLNVTKTYYITNTEGTAYSLKNMITRLTGYMENSSDEDGLFGLKKTDEFNFNLNVLVFLLIFILTGIFSFKYGISSPSSITLFVLVAVWFFEVTTELIDVLPDSEAPFLTIMASMIFLITFIREVQ